MLKLAKISKSTYFYIIKAFNREDKECGLKDEITQIFNDNKSRYGYRRITLELNNRGYKINHKKVERLMKALSLFASQPRAKYKSYKGDVGKTCKNLLIDKEVDEVKCVTKYKQNFKTTSFNQKWTTDISEFHIAAGKLYLSPILDMHNREIISFVVSRTPNYQQIKNMLGQAFDKIDTLNGLIFHSDQGWQYQMKDYQNQLKEKGIIQSMSRKGNCLDNSLMENFFGVIKNEMFYGHEHEFKTLEDLEEAIIEYIDYYNKDRITVKLKGLSPYFYRQQSLDRILLT